jgi:hypothetical protein
MMAFQATAEGGDRFAVVIDKGLRGEKNGLHANNGSIAKRVGRDEEPIQANAVKA